MNKTDNDTDLDVCDTVLCVECPFRQECNPRDDNE